MGRSHSIPFLTGDGSQVKNLLVQLLLYCPYCRAMPTTLVNKSGRGTRWFCLDSGFLGNLENLQERSDFHAVDSFNPGAWPT